MSKNKKQAIPQEITDKAQMYLDLWIRMNRSSDEQEIDSIRVQMAALWSTMTNGDIRDFHRESDAYDRKYGMF